MKRKSLRKKKANQKSLQRTKQGKNNQDEQLSKQAILIALICIAMCLCLTISITALATNTKSLSIDEDIRQRLLLCKELRCPYPLSCENPQLAKLFNSIEQQASNEYLATLYKPVTGSGRDSTNCFLAQGGSPGTRTYVWDAENRLTQITYPGNDNTSQFTYDALGHFVKIVETRNGSVTDIKQFVWSGDQLCEERDVSGVLKKRFFNLGINVNGNNYYFGKDHLGSVRNVLDENGSSVAEYEYDPWGRTKRVSGSISSDFGFGGYYRHRPSGLYLTVHRPYNPTLGRFITRDPIDDPGFNMIPKPRKMLNPSIGPETMASIPVPAIQDYTRSLIGSLNPMVRAQVFKAISPQPMPTQMPDANLYTYAKNNPISNTDPSGLFCQRSPANPARDPECEQDCHDDYDHNAERCRRLSDPDARGRCWAAIAEILGSCIQDCRK